MNERINGDGTHARPFHFQPPWWAGYNEARHARPYRNDYATVTARWEYQQGFETGAIFGADWRGMIERAYTEARS